MANYECIVTNVFNSITSYAFDVAIIIIVLIYWILTSSTCKAWSMEVSCRLRMSLTSLIDDFK